MEINNYQSTSLIHQQIALKKSELASIDKKEEQKSLFEKNDTITESGKSYDEKDYERVLSKFKDLDAKTRTHEQMHAQGAPTTTPISYNYQVGPDGKLYATGGHVRFDTSIPKDEASANVKLEQLKDASSAPQELSGADMQITRTANLNKLLLQSKQEDQGVSYEN